ncbi:MAG: YidC/Oxa1 family membrane protein insertase, partial [bacterium]
MTSLDPRKSKQPEGNNGLLIAVLVALIFMMGWDYMYPTAPVSAPVQPVAQQQAKNGASLPGSPEMLNQSGHNDLAVQAAIPAAKAERVMLANDVLVGAVALTGGRIDELELSQFDVILKGEDRVSMFSSSGKRIHFFDA